MPDDPPDIPATQLAKTELLPPKPGAAVAETQASIAEPVADLVELPTVDPICHFAKELNVLVWEPELLR